MLNALEYYKDIFNTRSVFGMLYRTHFFFGKLVGRVLIVTNNDLPRVYDVQSYSHHCNYFRSDCDRPWYPDYPINIVYRDPQGDNR